MWKICLILLVVNFLFRKISGRFYEVSKGFIDPATAIQPPTTVASLVDCYQLCFQQPSCKSIGYASDDKAKPFLSGKCFLLRNETIEKLDESQGEEVSFFAPFVNSIAKCRGKEVTEENTNKSSVEVDKKSAPKSCRDILNNYSNKSQQYDINVSGKVMKVQCGFNFGQERVFTNLAYVSPKKGIVKEKDLIDGIGSGPSNNFWFPMKDWMHIINYATGSEHEPTWTLRVFYKTENGSARIYSEYESFENFKISEIGEMTVTGAITVQENEITDLSIKTCDGGWIWFYCNGKKTGFFQNSLYHDGNELTGIRVQVFESF